jgi:hypothetical protein
MKKKNYLRALIIVGIFMAIIAYWAVNKNYDASVLPAFLA